MKHQRTITLAAMALGAAVPFSALTLAGALDPLGVAVAPFGWQAVIVVHVLATLPMAWLAAAGLVAVAPHRSQGMPVGAAVVVAVGFLIAWGTVRWGPSAAMLFDEARFSLRLVARAGWTLALAVPWTVLGQRLLIRSNDGGEPLGARGRPRLGHILLAGVVAVGLPGVYAVEIIDRQTIEAEQLLEQGRLARAWRTVQGLCQLGSRQPIGGRSPLAVRHELGESLRDHLAAIERSAQQPQRDDASRLDYARHLAIVGETTAAQRALVGLCDRDPQAARLMGATLQDEGRIAESSRWYRRAIDLINTARQSSEASAGQAAGRSGRSAQRDLLIRCHEALARNLHEQGAYVEAETLLLHAVDQLPESAAHWHFKLGEHYRMGGRPLKAIEHLETAVRLDGRYAARVERTLEQLSAQTPACFARPFVPVTR